MDHSQGGGFRHLAGEHRQGLQPFTRHLQGAFPRSVRLHGSAADTWRTKREAGPACEQHQCHAVESCISQRSQHRLCPRDLAAGWRRGVRVPHGRLRDFWKNVQLLLRMAGEVVLGITVN